ncbi:MAG TPA: 4-(cytidine 5'-diphospho)-2-C-methyl-D-erythritol kinase, partial [Firmicutes bacterium]|nr:4-(cytidine 5'-diphospho)-2-C-methyl-D-erythritol kinase [Bacillota bacterium]
MQLLVLSAHAKVNLCLDVLKRRPDGYHEVDMILQSIDLVDEVMLEQIGFES